MSKFNRPATISQITKCIKNNKHNVQINLNTNPEFEQATDFKIYRDVKSVEIETSLASKSINEDKHTLNYTYDQVIDIPRKLNESFDNKLDTNYYIFGVPKEDSFFHSLLYIISKDFKLKPNDVRLNYVKTLKDTMLTKVSPIFKNKSYTKYNYKRNDIIENIENTTHITEALICFASDYFGINLLILNYDNQKYWMGREFDESVSEKNVVIIFSNGVYLPLIHIYGEFPDNFIYKCVVNRFKLYRKLATQTELSVVEQETITKTNTNINLVSNDNQHANESLNASNISVPEPGTPVLANSDSTPEKPKLRGFSGYKLTELQELAQKHNLEINNVEANKSKPKTKRQLYDELTNL